LVTLYVPITPGNGTLLGHKVRGMTVAVKTPELEFLLTVPALSKPGS